MEVKDKLMYHFHALGCYDDLWQLGKIININQNFISNFFKEFNTFSGSVIKNGQKQFLLNLINDFFANKYDKVEALALLDASKEILEQVFILQREYTLEQVRQKYYPNLPSRKNSVWVCDEQSKLYWQQVFSNSYYQRELLAVKLNGILFKSSNYLLPKMGMDFTEMEDQAHKYWNPSNTLENNFQAEYLFQGKLEIVKKL